jgi:large subunit ribosomal protein L17
VSTPEVPASSSSDDATSAQSTSGAGGNAGAAGVRAGGGDEGATLDGETTGPGGDTSPAVADGTVDDEAQAIVTDVFNPDGERQDDGDVTPQPTAVNAAVVDDPNLRPDVAAAAAAEIEAAELGDAATAGLQAPGGEAAPDPK